MGDDEILQLFFHRVEYAISAVEEKYGRLCRSVARGILKDERDVEECVNDTCMRAWNAIPPEKPRSLEAYLVRITRNLALDRYAYHHSQKRETTLTEAYEELDAQPVQGANIISSKSEIEKTLDTLNAAFEKLLDSLFQDTAWNVSADISVLNTMLAQEGLTKEDFKK